VPDLTSGRRAKPTTGSLGTTLRDSPVSLIGFAIACATVALAQAVASGAVAPWLPWIVDVTARPWMPPPGQIGNVAAGFGMLAAACAPLERRQRVGPESSTAPYGLASQHRGQGSYGLTRWLGSHTGRATIAVLLLGLGTGLALAATDAPAARTQPTIIQNALRTQARGETALAFETLAPATAGPYERGKLTLYYLVSGWAADLHDPRLATTLSVDLMRAAADTQRPRSLVAGLYQYDLYGRRGAPPHALLKELIGRVPPGSWRTAASLLLVLPMAAKPNRVAAQILALASHLRPGLRARLAAALILLQADMRFGRVTT